MLLPKLTVRSDAAGDGHFQSPRSGGRKHEGVDFIVTPGQPVYAPERGYLKRIAYPYGNDTKNKGFVFIGDSGIEYKIFYAAPIQSKIGNTIEAGQLVAQAQDITLKYPNSPSMTPHIHVEMRKNGVLLNAETELKKKE